MELKTKVFAEVQKQDLKIERIFKIPVQLVFKAYTEAEYVSQWMGTNVIKLEHMNHGSYRFETTDHNDNVVFSANGVIHDTIPNKKITRTFEMENSLFPTQIEFLEFESLNENSSKLNIQIVYKSIEIRDEMLKLPFEMGLNMAHNKLENIFNKIK